MTIGQIVMYHNKAMEIKNGKPQSSLLNKSAKELRELRAKLISDAESVQTGEDPRKAAMRAKYGRIDG